MLTLTPESHAILSAGRCVSCMEPVNPLTPHCACIRSEIGELHSLRRDRDALVAALQFWVCRSHRQGGAGEHMAGNQDCDKARTALSAVTHD